MSPCSDIKQQFEETDRLKVEKLVSIQSKFKDALTRSEFARDRDRILFTRAFRRLQHKTQVFPNEKGDHYRTRLTHTLEVSQIARSLARYLSADEDLTEAIAIGHDIGHTPFGHEGEKVLDEIMCGNDELGMIKIPINHGGFKHNYNSIKILDIIESKFENITGLNLSWQVLEGIIKHTKINRCKETECTKCGKCWDIERFVNNKKLVERLHFEHKFSVTIEGQIVYIADEIAQRQHDLDDGLRGLPSNIKIDDLNTEIIKYIDTIIEKSKSPRDAIKRSQKEHLNDCITFLEQLKHNLTRDNKCPNDLLKQQSLIRNIIEYFIFDVFATTTYNYKLLHSAPIADRHLPVQIVDFSKFAEEFNDRIEKYVTMQIVNSYDVNKFDGKANYIIRQLFKAYYKNPLQMPHYVLKRLENKLETNSEYITIKLKGKDDSKIGVDKIKFKDGDRTDINSLVSILKLDKLDENIINQDELGIQGELKLEGDEKLEKFKDCLERITDIRPEDITSDGEKFFKCLLENNYSYISTICDYIAGMSDNYAKKEYKDLYLVD